MDHNNNNVNQVNHSNQNGHVQNGHVLNENQQEHDDNENPPVRLLAFRHIEEDADPRVINANDGQQEGQEVIVNGNGYLNADSSDTSNGRQDNDDLHGRQAHDGLQPEEWPEIAPAELVDRWAADDVLVEDSAESELDEQLPDDHDDDTVGSLRAIQFGGANLLDQNSDNSCHHCIDEKHSLDDNEEHDTFGQESGGAQLSAILKSRRDLDDQAINNNGNEDDVLTPLAPLKRTHGHSVSFREHVGNQRSIRHSVDIRNLPSYLTGGPNKRRTSIVEVARGLLGFRPAQTSIDKSSASDMDRKTKRSGESSIGDTTTDSSSSDEPLFETPIAPTLSLGQRVALVKSDGALFGTVGWIGRLEALDEEWSVGVEFDTPIGNTDGTYNGRRYFNSRANFAMFLPLSALTKTDNYIGRPETGTMMSRMSVALRAGQMISIQRTNHRLQHCFLNAPHQRVGHDVRAVSNRLHCQCHNCGPCAHLTKQTPAHHKIIHSTMGSYGSASISASLSISGSSSSCSIGWPGHSCHFGASNQHDTCCPVSRTTRSMAGPPVTGTVPVPVPLVPIVPIPIAASGKASDGSIAATAMPPRAIDLLAHQRRWRHRHRPTHTKRRRRYMRQRIEFRRKIRHMSTGTAANADDELSFDRYDRIQTDALLTDADAEAEIFKSGARSKDSSVSSSRRSSISGRSSSHHSMCSSCSLGSSNGRRARRRLAPTDRRVVRRFSNNLPVPSADDADLGDFDANGTSGSRYTDTTNIDKLYASAFMLEDDTESKFRKRLRQCWACLMPKSVRDRAKRMQRGRNSKKSKLIEYRRRQSTFVPSTLARPLDDLASHGVSTVTNASGMSYTMSASSSPSMSSSSSHYSNIVPFNAKTIALNDTNDGMATFSLEHKQKASSPYGDQTLMQSRPIEPLNQNPSPARLFIAITRPPRYAADDNDHPNDDRKTFSRIPNDDSHDSAFVECLDLQDAVFDALADHHHNVDDRERQAVDQLEQQFDRFSVVPTDESGPKSRRSSTVTISTLTTTDGNEQQLSVDVSSLSASPSPSKRS